jgi:hypothetical protein
MTRTLDQKVIEALEKKQSQLMAQLKRRGGRGVDLANEIDRLILAIDALRGNLTCPMCESQLTSEP